VVQEAIAVVEAVLQRVLVLVVAAVDAQVELAEVEIPAGILVALAPVVEGRAELELTVDLGALHGLEDLAVLFGQLPGLLRLIGGSLALLLVELTLELLDSGAQLLQLALHVGVAGLLCQRRCCQREQCCGQTNSLE